MAWEEVVVVGEKDSWRERGEGREGGGEGGRGERGRGEEKGKTISCP